MLKFGHSGNYQFFNIDFMKILSSLLLIHVSHKHHLDPMNTLEKYILNKDKYLINHLTASPFSNEKTVLTTAHSQKYQHNNGTQEVGYAEF